MLTIGVICTTAAPGLDIEHVGDDSAGISLEDTIQVL